MTNTLNIPDEHVPTFLELSRRAGEEGAPCHQDPELWFAAMNNRQAIATAKQQCNGDAEAGIPPCPVLGLCRGFALDTREPEGIWGGLEAEERQAITRRRTLDHRAALKRASTAARAAAQAEKVGQLDLFGALV